jgi:hypothetical protein
LAALTGSELDLQYFTTLLEERSAPVPESEGEESPYTSDEEDGEGAEPAEERRRGDGADGMGGGPVVRVLAEGVPLAQLVRCHEEFMGQASRAVLERGLEVEEDCRDLDRVLDVLSALLVEALPTREQRAWPPPYLTFLVSYAVGIQQGHTLLPSSAAILQGWSRCFTPLPPDRRHVLDEAGVLLGALTTARDEDAEVERENRRYTCDLLTLFFHMHTVWPLLRWAPPPADATWEGEDEGDDKQPQQQRVGQGLLSWGFELVEAGTGVIRSLAREAGRPPQWDEGEALAFLEEFGAYVRIEAVVEACLARGFEAALRWVLQELAALDPAFQQAREQVEALVSEGGFGPEDVGRVLEACRPTGAPLALVMALLPQLAEACPEAVPALAGELFPGLRPWALKKALLGKVEDPAESDRLWRVYRGMWAARVQDLTGLVVMGRGAGWNGEDARREAVREEGEVLVTAQELRELLLEGSGSGAEVLLAKALAAARSGESKEHHLALKLREALGEGGGAAQEGVIGALGPVDGLRLLTWVHGWDEAGAEEGPDVSLLRRVAEERVRQLRRGVVADRLLLKAKELMWRRQGSPSCDGIMPPAFQGVVLVEATLEQVPTAEGVRPLSLGKEQGDVEGAEADSKLYQLLLNDSIQGSCGLGLAWEPASACGVCGVGLLGAVQAGGSGRRPGQGQGQGMMPGFRRTITIFGCGHGFHTGCIPEEACIVCLDNSFPDS